MGFRTELDEGDEATGKNSECLFQDHPFFHRINIHGLVLSKNTLCLIKTDILLAGQRVAIQHPKAPTIVQLVLEECLAERL